MSGSLSCLTWVLICFTEQLSLGLALLLCHLFFSSVLAVSLFLCLLSTSSTALHFTHCLYLCSQIHLFLCLYLNICNLMFVCIYTYLLPTCMKLSLQAFPFTFSISHGQSFEMAVLCLQESVLPLRTHSSLHSQYNFYVLIRNTPSYSSTKVSAFFSPHISTFHLLLLTYSYYESLRHSMIVCVFSGTLTVTVYI